MVLRLRREGDICSRDGSGCQMLGWVGSGFEIFFGFGSGQVLKYFFGFELGSGLT